MKESSGTLPVSRWQGAQGDGGLHMHMHALRGISWTVPSVEEVRCMHMRTCTCMHRASYAARSGEEGMRSARAYTYMHMHARPLLVEARERGHEDGAAGSSAATAAQPEREGAVG